MKNDVHNVYSRLRFCCAAVLYLTLLIVSSFALADTPPLPPPSAISNTPNGVNLNYNSYGNSTYRLAPPPNIDAIMNSRAPHYGNAKYVGGAAGGVIHGVKQFPVTLTDTHGATARGSIGTTTVLPSSNTLANLGGALIAGQVMGSGVQRAQAGGIADAIANGNYGEAARVASASVADAVYAGAFSGINNIIDDVQSKKAQQAAAQAQAAAEQAAAANSFVKPDGSVYVAGVSKDRLLNAPFLYIPMQGDFQMNSWTGFAKTDVNNPSENYDFNLKLYQNGVVVGTYAFPNDKPVNENGRSSTSYYVQKIKVTPENIDEIKSKLYGMPQPAPSDFFATESEIAAALLEAMNRNTQALTDVVNAIAAAGGLNETNTTTTVDNGGTAQTTFLTAPYTPQGSNQAQQTSFTIHPDGSVTATTIPRPDLAAHTSQAPTRAPVGQTATTPATTAPKETATPEAPDICANNANSLMCSEIGSVDYSDPVLDEINIDISLNPLNVFASGGVCPQPIGFDLLGSRQEFSYDTMCDVAEKARPWIIILSMLFSFTLVYYALGLGKK